MNGDVLLLLTMSCDRDRHNGWQDAVSHTWLDSWGHLVDHRFVVGSNVKDPTPDEIVADSGDSYFDMVAKNQAGWRWALSRGYEYVFQSCNDTYIIVPRLLASNFRGRDYTGGVVYTDTKFPYYSGGTGYWLSRRAMIILTSQASERTHEDWWVGQKLAMAGIHATEDYPKQRHGEVLGGGYVGLPYSAAPFHEYPNWNGVLTVHLSRGTDNYSPSWMHLCHESFLKENPQ